MPIYIYESIPESCCQEPEHYEMEQEANDAPLTEHPETKARIRRVLIGGRELTKEDSGGGSCCSGPSGCCG